MLLVVAVIAILSGIVIVAVNPAKQFGDTRNAQRRVDVNTILNAVYQYAVDHNGVLPASITTSTTEICKTDAASCTGLVDFSDLTADEKYLVAIPTDPGGTSSNGAGYRIVKSANGRVTVTAPGAEQGLTVSVTR
jgi:type IV pilus assembly protein PilA